MLKSKMSWLEARQDVLSQNVANADTPGYAARDLKPMDFASLLKKANGAVPASGLMVTDPRHIAVTPLVLPFSPPKRVGGRRWERSCPPRSSTTAS